MNYHVNFLGRLGRNGFYKGLAPMAILKNPNPGDQFGATRLTALPIQPIYLENGPNGLN